MGVMMLEQHRNFSFQISSIHFSIEQESDFDLSLNTLQFPSTIARLNHHSLLFSLESEVSITGHRYGLKMPNAKCIGGIFQIGSILMSLIFFEFGVLLTSLDSWRVALHVPYPESC